MPLLLQVRRFAGTALAVAYPLFAHAASVLGSRSLTLASVAILAMAVLARPLLSKRRWAWLALPVLALAFAALWKLDSAALVLFLPPVLLNAYLAWLFGHTLARGGTPLIERLVRLLQPPGVPPEEGVVEYAQLLTKMWAALFVVLALTNLVLAACARPAGLLETIGIHTTISVSRETWSLFANVLNYLIVAAVFLLEFSYRRRRFPGRPYRNLPDFLRRAAAVGPALLATIGRKQGTRVESDRGEILERDFVVPVDHPSFAGHFPGRPVLPGVVVLERVIEEAGALFNGAFNVAELPRVKFTAPLLPGDRATLRLKRRGDLLEFELRRGATRIAQGVFRMRSAGTPG
jgi:uncharacterized membrane protein